MTIETTVIIVDDDPAFLESLSLLITSMGLRTRCYASGDEFLSAYDPNCPGCLILDVRMSGTGGLAVQEKLAKEILSPPILIMTAHADVPTALRAVRQGAVEFLQKTFSESELWEALQRALTLDSQNRREHARREAIRTRFELLTRPEREVLDLILQGQPNKSIAATLSLSRRAVEDRRARLMQKLSVQSLAELVRLATEANLHFRAIY